MGRQTAGLGNTEASPLNAFGGMTSTREAVTPGPHNLFAMCQILQNRSSVLRRDAMEIRAIANEVLARARTLRR